MKKGIIVALILMSIGFAAVTATLTINGTINLGFNKNDYDIYFSRAIVNGEIKSKELINETKKEITFTTNELKTIGEQYILKYEVTNNSRQYDAEVTVNCEPADAEAANEYLKSENSMSNKIIKAQSREEGTLTITLKKAAIEQQSFEYTCTITANATERDDAEEEYLTQNTCDIIPTPNLGSDGKLIPVEIRNDGEVRVVRTTDSSWYNYCEKRWANAVILNDGVETEYNPGDTIPESDIESMFVWIPKYKYKLWNVETDKDTTGKHTIEIIFDTENTTEDPGKSCETPMTSGNKGSCADEEYMTHPAFTSFGVNGFWVGKFETGYREANDKASAQQNNNEPRHIIIKPNAYSWRSLTLKNMFEAAYNYDSSENRDLDSHMMKNTEWGAVAYLSHSKYGIDKEVRINNNNAMKTGYAALPNTDQSNYPGASGDGSNFNTAWNTENGFTASTTGNITGVYDMSGGAWEYMAAYVEGKLNNSGFQDEDLGKLDPKFIDEYDKESTVNSYKNMILGDATGEMGPFNKNDEYKDNVSRYNNSWYVDFSDFVDVTDSWFRRGGNYSYGALAGQFSFARRAGAVDGTYGFRIVLAPSN